MVTTLPRERKARPSFTTRAPFDTAKAWKMRVINKLTYEEIGKQLGVPHQTVYSRLKKLDHLLPDPEQREAFQQSKTDIFEHAQMVLTASLLQPAKIQKATLGNVAYAVSKLNDMIRLDRGQSTSNVSVLTRIIDDSHTKLFGQPQVIDNAPPNPFD
jgi:hypothetical protein